MSVRIDLWRWRLDGGDDAALSPDEVARAARFVFDRDRDRYVAGRARLRAILAGYVGARPDALRFDYGPQGRPTVAGGPSFNLSHTGGTALLAVSRDGVVGADVEAVAPIDLAVAGASFARAEVEALEALPETERTAAFYRGWTRREAYLKARGTGLATDLTSFEVTLGPGEPPRLLRCASGEAALWRIEDVAMGDGLAAAVAARSGGRPLDLRWRSG